MPDARPRVAVASDGTLAAITEPSRVVVVGLPDGVPRAEVGLDGEAATEVAWVGTPPRLLVLARYEAHSTVHLVDVAGPHGATTLAEMRLETPMRLYASVGPHVLVVGGHGAAVITAPPNTTHLTPYQFLSRTMPLAAGAAGAQFVVALPGTIEEWDPATRMPKRRLRLPRPAAITAVGGSDRVVWMTTQQAPARIDVMPLVNRGQPKSHDLPEAIAAVHGHPRSDIIVCTGAETGRLYAVDLDGRTRLRTITADGVDRVEAAGLIVGRMVGVIAAQTHRPLAIILLDGREPEPASSSTSRDDAKVEPAATYLGDDEQTLGGKPSTLSRPDEDQAPSTVTAGPPAGDPETVEEPPPEPAAIPEVAPARAPRAAWSTGASNLTSRFSALRGRESRDDPRTDVRASWRDDVVLWARAIAAGTFDRAAPSAPPIDTLAARFGLPEQLVPALILLYGVHLAGHHGAAPIDVARVHGRRWDEALGRGQLAALGLALYERSRVILTPAILRSLDERAPATGTLVGEPGVMTLLGPCAVVATDGSLVAIAERLLASVGGAILAAHADADREELLVEARARGAAPLLRLSPGELERLPVVPMIVVAADEQLVEALGVPRLL